MIIGRRREMERREDVLDVLLDGVLGDDELLCDCLVGAAFGHQMSPTVLADAVGMSTGGLSISLGRLERSGYVRRTMDPKDRRGVSVELTRKAQRVEQQIFGPLLGEVASLLEGYSEAELDLICEFLQRVRGAVAAAGRPKGQRP